ncbi:hypothetical protein T484DRAFT_1756747, partial [Baffinella frigidus]
MSVDDARWCAVENFPVRYWKMLRGLVRTHINEEAVEETRQVEHIHHEGVIEDVLNSVLGPVQTFVLMISIDNEVGENVLEYLPLHRTNGNFDAVSADELHFNVQRSSLRRFTTVLTQTTRTHHPQQFHILRSSILMGVNEIDSEDDGYLMRISQVSDIELPAFQQGQDDPVSVDTLTRTVSIDTPVLTVPVAVLTVQEMGVDQLPPDPVSVDTLTRTVSIDTPVLT